VMPAVDSATDVLLGSSRGTRGSADRATGGHRPDRAPFENALSIGCGVGNLERSLVGLELVGHAIGVEASAPAVEVAREAPARARMTSRIGYVTADAHALLARRSGLGAIFFHQSLRHFA